MDKIIARYNFAANREEDWRRVIDELDAFTRADDQHTADTVFKGLAALEKQVGRKDFPSEGTEAYYMASKTLKEILTIAQYLVDEGKASEASIQDALMDFVLKMFEWGPGSTHCKLIREVFSDGVDFSTYFESLRGEKLVRVIKALRRPFTTEEKENPSRLDVELEPTMRDFIDTHGFTEEQYKDAHEHFLDLYRYYDTNFLNSPPELYKRMTRFAYFLRMRMDDNPYKGLDNVQVYRESLKLLRDIFSDPKFPQKEDLEEDMCYHLEYLLAAINENGRFSELYDDVMDFMEAITSKGGDSPLYKTFEKLAYFFYHLEENNVKGKTGLFEGLMKRHIKFMENLQDKKFLDNRYPRAICSQILEKCVGTSKEHTKLWIEMLIVLLRIPRQACVEAAYYELREREKTIKWKEHPEAAKTIFSIISEAKVAEDLEEKRKEKTIDYYKEFVDTFQDGLKRSRMLNLLTPAMYQFGLGVLESKNEPLFDLARQVVGDLDFNAKKDKEHVMSILRRLVPLLQDEDFPWIEEDMGAYCIGTNLAQKALDNLPDGKNLTREDLEVIHAMFMSCADKEFVNHFSGTVGTVYFIIMSMSGAKLVSLLTKDNEDLLTSMMGPSIAMLEHEDEQVQTMGSAFVDQTARKNGALVAPYMDKLLELLLDLDVKSAMVPVSEAYEHNPDPLTPRFQEIFDLLDSSDISTQFAVAQLLPKVAKKQPQLFTEENVTRLVEEARGNPNVQFQHLDALQQLAAHRPDLVLSQLEEILNEGGWQPHCMYAVCGILKHIGGKYEKESFRVTEYFAKILRGPEDQTTFMAAMDGLRCMVPTQRVAVENQKEVVVALRGRTKNQYIRDVATGLIDVLEGRSLEGLSTEVQQTQEDVEKLDTRVTATEVAIVEVQSELERQKHTIHGVQIDLERQADKLQSYDEAMKEANLRLDQIDAKTLSHAPFWAKDVAKVMNPEAAHDWRLLSRRLGYSNDDIRGWAQQADPCLAMLNEWFATNKTSRAIFGVLTALQDINRIDAAAIVENAMKAMDKVVEEPPSEYASPPEVFLSYQWGHQNEVKLLKQHLEKAGFSCWMDIGQMGGGDKLFEKIDSGIRGAKVVVSCVSPKYGRSPNCNREVQLAVATGKPIIPLLMEKMAWPPEGAMGPIFSEYLFIRFFQRPGEESGDSRYWPPAKFQELLMQLNLNGAKPDQSLVQPEYKDWWMPIVEEIKIEKKKDGGSTASSKPAEKKDEKATAGSSPSVFLSYQWDKQRQVLALYKRLTSLGLTCWMDIFQMGGGDSLYDKIDRGLRGCKMVVSCVTTKYALSANCRREVALADALRKPLVPLLLEKQGAWPPPGPMSMVLAPLLYVDFVKQPQEQDTWDGVKFDELLAKIREHVDVPEDASGQGKNGSASTQKPASTPSTASSSPAGGKTTTIVRKKPVAMKPASSGSGGGQGGVVVRAIANVKATQGNAAPMAAAGSKQAAPAAGKEGTRPPPQQAATPRAAGKTQPAPDAEKKNGRAPAPAASRPQGSLGRNPASTAAPSSTRPAAQPGTTGTRAGPAARKSSIGTGGNSSSTAPAAKGTAPTAAGSRDARVAAGGRAGARPDPKAGRAGAPGRSTTTRR